MCWQGGKAPAGAIHPKVGAMQFQESMSKVSREKVRGCYGSMLLSRSWFPPVSEAVSCLAIRRRIERMAAVDAVRLASARLQASRAVAVPKSIQFLFSILVRLPCSLPRQSELRVWCFFLTLTFTSLLLTRSGQKKLGKYEGWSCGCCFLRIKLELFPAFAAAVDLVNHVGSKSRCGEKNPDLGSLRIPFQ